MPDAPLEISPVRFDCFARQKRERPLSFLPLIEHGFFSPRKHCGVKESEAA
jgi:hypothetical protein